MTPIAQNTREYTITSCTRRVRLLGRGLLGSERRPHGLGDPCALVPLTAYPITGPLTDTGISVKRAGQYSRSGGYLLMDSGLPGVPWEIVAHLGPRGEGMLARPRDEGGRGILRSCFGTPMVPISNQVFAYEMPYRYPDRYQEEVDSESLAFLQKSFRVPGATWRSIQWAERQGRSLRERRCDVVVAARFDGEPEWSAKPTHEPGGLYLFEEPQRRSNRGPSVFELNRKADQLEVRIYFRYPAGSFTRLPGNLLTDDWKETPVLEYLTVEYEKGGSVLRHEELPF